MEIQRWIKTAYTYMPTNINGNIYKTVAQAQKKRIRSAWAAV